MNVPKSIHKCLLGMGYRYVGHNEYWKMLPDKPVAQSVQVDYQQRGWHFDTETYDEAFWEIGLGLYFPSHSSWRGENRFWVLCPDGTMQEYSSSSDTLDVQAFREGNENQAAEVLRHHLDRHMAELVASDRWLGEVEKPCCGREVDTKFHYLLLAERYDEIKELLQQFPLTEFQMTAPASAFYRAYYRYRLACAEQGKIIVTDEEREWAEKKKLVAPNTWESVPSSTFLDKDSTQNQETATMSENLYALFFSKKTALQSFVQTRFGVELAAAQGEKVSDALDAAEVAEQTEFVVRSPKSRWFVLLGAIEQTFDDGEDKLTTQLAQASDKAEVLLIANEDTSGSLVFEYHKNGKLKRRWQCSDGEIESVGKALNDLDKQSFISKFDEENGTPDTDILVAMAESVTGLEWSALSGAGTLYGTEQAAA